MEKPTAVYLLDSMIAEGTRKTSSGNYIFYFNEIKKKYQVDLNKEKKLLGEIIAEARLHRSAIIADLVVDDGCLDFNFYLDYCPNYDETEEMEMSI